MAKSTPSKTASAPQPAPGDAPNMALVTDAMWAFGRTHALTSAIELKVFDPLEQGPKTAADIAKALKLSARGVRILLDVLVGLELLAKNKDAYALNPTSATFLVTDSPAYVGEFVQHARMLDDTWNGLTETVRTGKPAQAVDLEERGREFFPKLVGALFPPSFGASRAAREALPPRLRSRVKRVLDVAAGSAAWSLAWAAADPEVKVTVVDFPEVFEVARRYTGRFGTTDRYEFKPGNLRKVSFGKEKYDLVILGHICHSEGAKWSQKLIEKSAKALAPGGLLLIGEMIPNDKRTGPVQPLLFGINMLVNTEEGDVFTLAEYKAWMTAAGLSSIRRIGPEGVGVIVGEKKQ
jgi:3-hydroxy-5-methyl-1-naphthoate 3-O-methyltransferase